MSSSPRLFLRRTWRAGRLATLPLSLVLAACGGNKSTSTASATADASQTTSTVSCATDSRVTPYKAGMQVAGASGVYTFTIVSMQPAPPATGTGTLSVQLTDKTGTALSDATLSLALFMPDHGHGSSITPQVAASAGVYTISDVYLFMPGVWRMSFSATSADKSQSDTGVVLFCVPG